MIEGLRAEFPSAFRIFPTIPGPRIAPASVPLAVLAAIGAQLLVTAIAELIVVVIYPVFFPPLLPPPFTFPTRVLWESAGAIAAGAVVARAGGLRATFGYVVVQMMVLLLALPLRLFACSRSTANQGPGSCDFVIWSGVVDQWPLWVALAVGVALARILPLRPGGSNQILLAAGLLSVCTTLGGSLSSLWLVTRPSSVVRPDVVFTYLSLGVLGWIGLIAGGALAGRVLVRSPLAAAVLLSLAVIGPAFAFGFPLIRGQVLPGPPGPLYLSYWSWVWTPIAASIAMFAAREIALLSRPRRSEPAD